MTAETATLCEQEGCQNEGIPCWYPDYVEKIVGDQLPPPDHYYCGDHTFDQGFCSVCGDFWGGIESFEFHHPGLCDNCYSEVDQERHEYDDDDLEASGYDEEYP